MKTSHKKSRQFTKTAIGFVLFCTFLWQFSGFPFTSCLNPFVAIRIIRGSRDFAFLAVDPPVFKFWFISAPICVIGPSSVARFLWHPYYMAVLRRMNCGGWTVLRRVDGLKVLVPICANRL